MTLRLFLRNFASFFHFRFLHPRDTCLLVIERWFQMIEYPIHVVHHVGVNARLSFRSAVSGPVRYDSVLYVLRYAVYSSYVFQRTSAVAPAGVSSQDSTGAYLSVGDGGLSTVQDLAVPVWNYWD